MTDEIEIRPLRPDDDVGEITALLHRAYAGLAAMGFRYLATWQDDETTSRRLAEGESWLALRNGRVVGTITLVLEGASHGCEWYARPGVAHFAQFGVEPELQGAGIGSALMDVVERRAAEEGMAELSLDTAEGAAHLIRWYESRGYRHVGFADWEVTNYRSVLMSLALPAGSPPSR